MTSDPLVDRFSQDPDLSLDDDAPKEAEVLEQRLSDHDGYQESDVHPDDEASIGSVHEEYLGPPPPGVTVDEVDGGAALRAATP